MSVYQVCELDIVPLPLAMLKSIIELSARQVTVQYIPSTVHLF